MVHRERHLEAVGRLGALGEHEARVEQQHVDAPTGHRIEDPVEHLLEMEHLHRGNGRELT